MKKFLASFCLGIAVGLLVAGAFFYKIGSSTSQVHRVSVNYPSRWEEGEFRNCQLGRPHYSGDRLPEFSCDGSGSLGEATSGAHAFVMDVRFLGEYKVPADDRRWTWTCQSSVTGTGELTCKEWHSPRG
jgi:hypothetical protein